MEDLLPQGQGDNAARIGVAFQNRWDTASKGGSHHVCGGQPDRPLPRDVEFPEQIAQNCNRQHAQRPSSTRGTTFASELSLAGGKATRPSSASRASHDSNRHRLYTEVLVCRHRQVGDSTFSQFHAC